MSIDMRQARPISGPIGSAAPGSAAAPSPSTRDPAYTRRSRSWLVSLAAVVLAGCGSAEADWQLADAQGTVAGFQRFVAEHPNDPHASQARARIQALQDEQAWSTARRSGTLEAFKHYVRTQLNGLHLAEARDRLNALERAAAWKVAQAENSPAAIQAFLDRYPDGRQADEARAQLEKLTDAGFRVDLGEYRRERDAHRALENLKERFADTIPGLTVMRLDANAGLYRVSSQRMTFESAQTVCGTVQRSHPHCKVVRG